MRPLSIITVNLNNQDGLQKTIDSVNAQTFRDFEWIVIDGGSTDGSRDLLERNARLFDFWVSEPDGGIYQAMNKGIKKANGDYCLFLNSGDYLYENSTLASVFSSPHSESFFWGKILYEASPGNYIKQGFDNTSFSAFELFRNSFPHQASFIRREVLLTDGLYDESYKIISDLKFFYEHVIASPSSMACIDLIISVVDGKGISSNLEKSRIEEDRLFCEYYPERLLKDYYNWLEMKKEIALLNTKISRYQPAIIVYDAIRKHGFMRKIHTLIYKICIRKSIHAD